jgi:acyl-CoA dehydrogenase family protein 9
MTAYPYERLVRDSRINMIFEGTNEIQRLSITLSGFDGSGQRLAQLAKAVKDPIDEMGVVYKYVATKVSHKANADHLTLADQLLRHEAAGFEDGVKALAVTVETALRKPGKHIIDEQFLHTRVAEIAMRLYVQLACIARVTAQTHAPRPDKTEMELFLCKAACA